VANPLTAPSGMGAALALLSDAPVVVLSGLAGGENDRGEDASMATRREGASYCGEAAGGLELNTTIS
jgi:methylmalonyl-CoA mutase cobalamin-binding subunit